MTLKEYLADKGFTKGEFKMFDKKTQELWRKEHYDMNRNEQIERDRFPSTFMNSIDFIDEKQEIVERELQKRNNTETL